MIELFMYISILLITIIFLNTDGEISVKRYILFSLMVLLFGIFAIIRGYEAGFKEGQIKALTGDIRYELVTEIDSTKTWKEIE
jgi:hypothetical protein